MALRELDQRHQQDGKVQVTLLWDDEHDVVVLRITDTTQPVVKNDAVKVPKADALVAFRHPFSYLGKLRVVP